jgi:phosphopantothenoylcysteine decarboxylase/phosphopantothenate--cysteine ligase
LGKKILFGITGSIAAYRVLETIRLIHKLDQGFEVKVVMTKSACEFIQPLSFETLCGHPVYLDTFEYTDSAMEHIELARWADHIVVAPASANIIGKIANGLADDLLSTLLMARQSAVTIVPAMNMHMWQNLALQGNLVKVKKHGCHILGPDQGEQACGDYGFGRMVAPEVIVEYLADKPSHKKCLVKVLITAGPTVEPIDPVRFLSNHSSGKMGYALAESLQSLGANVTLVSGPTQLEVPYGVDVIKIKTAQEMYEAVMKNIEEKDIFIAAAAVADYRIKSYSENKIKKQGLDEKITLEMIKNLDILKAVSASHNRPFCVGFAAETNDPDRNARKKMMDKQLDMLVLNRVDKKSGFPFYADENQVDLYLKGIEMPKQFDRLDKSELATKLTKVILERLALDPSRSSSR